jgi:transcriptional regulator with XRE-family HTH domain
MPEGVPEKWQAILCKNLENGAERERLSQALGINPITLMRWARGKSNPQRSYLARLIKVVQPEFRSDLHNALLEKYPDMRKNFQEETVDNVPSFLYREVLRERGAIIEHLHPWQLSNKILDEALRLLDPHRLGMAITPVLCMPPDSTGMIETLHEQGGRGTQPWASDLEHMSIFLGGNSLAGNVVQRGRPEKVEDIKNERSIPCFAFPEKREVSAAAWPLHYEGRIAGCLLAVSTQVGHFIPERMALLEHFASLYALLLSTNTFYPSTALRLHWLLEGEDQLRYLRSFRETFSKLMITSRNDGKPFSHVEAELLAWQKIENQLIQATDRNNEQDQEN